MSVVETKNQNTTGKPIKIGLNDAVYPERIKLIMGSKAPPHLYMLGNIDILNMPGIGFCGSRKSSEKGLETAKDCAQQSVEHNIVVVSGNAAGVDFEAHFNSLKAGGKTILVLPEGINHFRIQRALKPVWNWKNVLVVSQFEPDDIWQSFRAMMRNQLIIALSRVMIVIEAGEKGGTLNAGIETLKSGLPLFVAEYQDMSVDAKGNKFLIDRGAHKLAKNRNTNRANLSRVIKKMNEDGIMQCVTLQGSFL
jgi:DNA processing protein